MEQTKEYYTTPELEDILISPEGVVKTSDYGTGDGIGGRI